MANKSGKKNEEDSAHALIQQGEKLVRLQDDSMQAVAVQRPRDLEAVRAGILAEIKAFPEFGERYYYSIPHRTPACGGHPTTQACDKCVYVEGLSINAAMAIQRYWGNCYSGWHPGPQDEEEFWCIGVFVDYEHNTKFERPFRAAKKLKLRNGNVVDLSLDRLTKAINAAGSKAQRNAVLSATPDPLKHILLAAAKRVAIGPEPQKLMPPEKIAIVATEFARFGVSLELLEHKMGKKTGAWTMEDRAVLVGLRNALNDGEAAETLFGAQVKKTEAKPVEPLKIEMVDPIARGVAEGLGLEPVDKPPVHEKAGKLSIRPKQQAEPEQAKLTLADLAKEDPELAAQEAIDDADGATPFDDSFFGE